MHCVAAAIFIFGQSWLMPSFTRRVACLSPMPKPSSYCAAHAQALCVKPRRTAELRSTAVERVAAVAACLLKPSLSRSPVHTACAGCKDSLADPIKRSRQRLCRARMAARAPIVTCMGLTCSLFHRAGQETTSAGQGPKIGCTAAVVVAAWTRQVLCKCR